MKYLFLASAALMAVASAASAADLETPSFNWTGFYLGGQIGGGWVNGPGSSDPNAVHLNVDGVIGGAYAGYNWQAPGSNLVLGVDTDILASGLDGSGRNALGNTASGKWEWYGATRGRVGYAFDRFLPYIAGGVAYGHVKASYGFPDGSIYSGGKTDAGWTIGAGLEYAISDHLTARAEYRHTDFGKMDVTLTGAGGSGVSEIKMPIDDVRFGLAYKF